MFSIQQLRAQVEKLINGSSSIDEFEDWFLSNGWNAHLEAPSSVVKAVHRIEGNLLDLSAGAIGVDSFRQELAAAIRPFVEMPRVYTPFEKRVFGKPLAQSLSASRYRQVMVSVPA